MIFSWNCLLKTHTHHTLLTTEAISLQENMRWTGKAHLASREVVDSTLTSYCTCHCEILYTRTEGLEQEMVLTQSNRLGKTVLLYFYWHLRKKLWFWKKEHAPLLTTAHSKKPAGEVAKGPVGASYGSQLLPLRSGLPKSQARVWLCKRQWPRKQFEAFTLLAVDCSSSFFVYQLISGLYHSCAFVPKDST